MDLKYVSCHHHSDYSFLDGICRIPETVQRTVEMGLPALAITDHGNMCSASELYKECKKAGVKPILGCEWYVVPDASVKEKRGYYHLLMLARDFDGYRAMVQLSRYASRPENFYYVPRIDRRILESMSEFWDHVVVSSACPSGELAMAIQGKTLEWDLNSEGEHRTPQEILQWHRDLFPQYYIELMQHNIEPKDSMPIGDTEINRRMIVLAQETGIPLLVTNDSHYLNPADKDVHTLIKAVRFNKVVEPAKDQFSGDGYWYKTPEELLATFVEVGMTAEAQVGMANTLQVAAGTDIVLAPLDNRSWFFPSVEEGTDEINTLSIKCLARFDKIRGLDREKMFPVYVKRLTQEMGFIQKAGFAGYMLVAADYITWAKKQGIMVGPGRGSVCGSLVAFLTDITDVDPIRHELLFERFLDPERIQDAVPDIDIDFEDRRRGEVVDYIISHYGADRAGVVCNYSQLHAKSAVKSGMQELEYPI